MLYNVRYIEAKCLNQIQKEWMELQTGKEMTLFQSYSWYQMLLEYYVPTDTREFESVFAIVESDGHPCMIAPLWIVKKTFRFLNQKGFYLLGRCSFSDYLNFVYKVFDAAAFDFLVSNLSMKYGLHYFVLEDFRESTSSYLHIISNYTICRNSDYPCVSLSLPSSVEKYQNLLSKNSRQNLRTANNRLEKDGKRLLYNFDNQQVDKKKCLEMREARLIAKYSDYPFLTKYKYRILNYLRYSFPSFIPITAYFEGKTMTASDEKGNLRAFFNYGYDPNGAGIRIMAAGTDIEYARYSPGMLLMYNFILNAIENGELKEIDFTRGDEKYKFSLGGQLSLYHTIKFKIM